MELGPARSGRDSFDVRVCTPNLCYICWDMMTFWHTTWTDQRQDPGAIVSGGATATPPISQSLMLIDLFRPTREFRRLICAQPCLSFTFFFLSLHAHLLWWELSLLLLLKVSTQKRPTGKEQKGEKKSKRSDDDRQSERQQRRAIDDLRSFIKHMDPPIMPEDTWEKIRPRLVRTPEFKAVTSEEARRGAFEKVLRRVRDREEEDRDRPKRRERSPDRGTYREKDRGDRSHRSDRVRPSRTSRSPEPDAYEADRRKAIAEREKNYQSYQSPGAQL
jgi:hypothetical protein